MADPRGGGGPPPNLPRPGTNRLTRAATSNTTGGVRRNLFQSHLTRRPTSTGSTGSSSERGGGGGGSSGAGSATTLSSSTHHHGLPSSSSTNSADTLRLDTVDVLSDTSEIVIRDKNGEYEVGDPPTPPLDEPDEEVALDDAQENERERHKLAEAVRHHQINHTRMPAQPEEVLETLRASMRAKVAALSEDNWMYEAEEQVPVH
ncbi:hypothetical protein F5Y16DRAFT_143575 [Xylariaceae sp. FL0255]|nr:hypothetical protein F5Y16DRAFT_143575 [Xylariaceae sp. FL0255]